jgi:c-di-GMP-binding flagellar brake protein YcgR
MPEAQISFERRNHPRIPLKIPVKYWLINDPKEIEMISTNKRHEQNTHTINVSLSGLYIVLDEKLNVGSIIRLDISIPDYSVSMAAFAEVVWSNKRGGGLRFEAIKEADQEVLKNFLLQIPNKN